MIRFILWIAVTLFLCVGTFAAEQATPNKSDTKQATPAGSDSPQAVFEIFRKAVIADDWTTALAQFDEPSRQFLIAGKLGGAMMGALGEQGKEIARAHLTDEQKFSARMEEVLKLPQKEQNAAARSLAEYVKDAPGLCQKITAFFREKKRENWMLDLDKTTLSLEKEGPDMAEGTMRVKTEKRSSSEPMNFRKIDGRWFLNYNG